MHVALGHIVIGGVKIVGISCKENPSALAAGLGLDDEGSGLALLKLSPKVPQLGRQQPGLGKKLVFVWELFAHLH